MEWLIQRFELSRGGSTQNVRPMEGLRGLAVFLVFLVHYAGLMRPWLERESALSSLALSIHYFGNTGVDLFFVLSGYLIYGTLIKRSQLFVPFIQRRIQRIYPTFIAVFALYIALSFVFPKENKIPLSFIKGTIYLVENFLLLPGLLPIEPMITVAWSLSYEMFYYLAIPLIIALFGLRNRTSLWRVIFFLTLAAAAALYCGAFGGPLRLIMFVSGILLYEATTSRSVRPVNSLIGFLALGLGILAPILPISGTVIKASICFVSFFFVGLMCLRNSTAWLSFALSWTPIRWLGNMSYSYYLIHGLTLKAVFLVLARVIPHTDHPSWLFWTLLPTMFATTLFPSAILFLVVERPFSLAPHQKPSKVVDPSEKSILPVTVDRAAATGPSTPSQT